jgi:large subunit ribosomal protein L18
MKYFYIQCVDDNNRHTLVGLNSRQIEGIKANNHIRAAKEMGKLFGQRMKEKGIQTCVFDRSGYLYHGRVKAIAEGIREAGVKV